MDRWQRQLAEFPATARAGPYFLVAQALERLGQRDEAALAYLRLPIHFAGHRRLSARALLATAPLLQPWEQRSATTVLRELADHYGESPEAEQAKRLLAAENGVQTSRQGREELP